MENFLEFVIQHLVDAPEEVLVTKLEQGKKLVFKVEMRRSDVGKAQTTIPLVISVSGRVGMRPTRPATRHLSNQKRVIGDLRPGE